MNEERTVLSRIQITKQEHMTYTYILHIQVAQLFNSHCHKVEFIFNERSANNPNT